MKSSTLHLPTSLGSVLGLASALLACVCPIKPASAGDQSAAAREYKQLLVGKIMPYWYDTGIDRQNGGYLLSDNGSGQPQPAKEKQLVTQSRMVWGFAHAHRNGLGDAKHDYLKAAEQGYRFLLEHFLDLQNGGYYWTTDLTGAPQNQRKIVYGESFVIYAFVEYYRASGDKQALRQAFELYRVLQRRAHDSKYGGWIEHFEPDWTPILKRGPEAIVEVGGMKSANTHLHLMEALTELYEASRDPEVRKSLEEAVRINAVYFYPTDPGKSCFHRNLDWSPTTEPSSAGLSYGHNVEFAWLFVRAQQVLGRPPSWDHFDAHIQHALRYGYDHERGGLYSRGMDNQPATDTDKIWWVQSEMMAALSDGLKHKSNADYSKALDSLVGFINKYQADPTDGVWYDTVAADGTPKNKSKAHSWKANYHDVRALVKFIRAFGDGQ